MFKAFRKLFRNKKTIHLDYASATPVHSSVLKEMLPYFSHEWANPSAVYASGVRARTVIETARTELARALRIRPHGIIFTASGTESNNLALLGYIEALHETGRTYADMEIISTRIEHPSILETLTVLASRGVNILYVALHDDGHIDIGDFETKLSTRTVLVTFSYVNSEIGVVQDVKRITRLVRAYMQKGDTRIAVHIDACQAPLWLSCEMDMLGVDLMSLDGGKCYGPKGVGVLALRHGISVSPQLMGGGQERGLRSGTENTALIVGFSHAFLRAQNSWKSRSDAADSLRDFMFAELLREIPSAVVNGGREARVANNVNISISDIDSEFAVITLDAHGIAASTKSACGRADSQGSYVVGELTGDSNRARSTIRFTLGEETTKEEIKSAVNVLSAHVIATKAFHATLKDSIV
jgi:cysteine desulfurase